MRYFHSRHNFRSYRPRQSIWLVFGRIFRTRKKIGFTASMPSLSHKGNPFKKIGARISLKSKLLVLILILIGWATLLLYMPFFVVNEIDYSGFRNMSREETDVRLRSRFFNCHKLLPCRNYFIINERQMEKWFMETFSLNSAKVEKIFPAQIIIDVDEKVSALIYDNGEKYYQLDNLGYVKKYLSDVQESEFREAQKSSPPVATSTMAVTSSNTAVSTTINTDTTREHLPDWRRLRRNYGVYPVLYDKRARDVEHKQKNVISPQFIQGLINWYNAMEKQGIGEVAYFIMETEAQGAKAIMSSHWDIYFDPTVSVEDQLNRLRSILRDNKPTTYVDLRYGEKVYWK